MNLPIRTRLTAWYALMLVAILVALGAFLVLKLRSDLRSSIDRSLRGSSGAIALNYDDNGIGGFRKTSAAALRRSGDGAQILDLSGRVVASYGGDVAQDPMISRHGVTAALVAGEQRFQANLGDSSQPYVLMVTPVAHRKQTRVLVVAASLQAANEAVRKILILLLIAGPIALAAAAFAGWWVVRNALMPVERMRRKAERIGIDQLHERLTAPRSTDEIGQLAGTLNQMLDRLEAGVSAKRQLIADASHELRTPLAAMRAELDVSLRQDERSAADRAVLESVREDVDRMSRTVDNLLTLSRADEGQLELMRSEVDLLEVARTASGSLQPLADAKKVSLVLTGTPGPTEGDPHRIRQAITNLIENAVEFTPPGGQVTVSAWSEAGQVGVTVADSGPGIAPEERDRVFDRFYRVEPSRSRRTGGSGLGLAICVEIAAAHGGRIWLDTEEGSGSRFSFALPAAGKVRPAAPESEDSRTAEPPAEPPAPPPPSVPAGDRY
jgi:heavy metal sensor kinase